MAALVLGAAGKLALADGLCLADLAAQKVQQPAGKFQRVFRRGLVLDQCRIAGPADLHAAEQIGLGFGHAMKPGGREFEIAENLGIRLERGDGAAAVDRAAPVSNVFMHEHMRHLKDALGDRVYTFFARMQKITGIEFHKVDMDVALAQLADKQVTLGNVEAACRAANIPARWDQFNQSIRD